MRDDLDDSQRKLMAVFEEFKARTGKTPMFCNENGRVFVHRDIRKKLDEPGNEAALEFLRYMQRMGVTKRG